MRNFFSELSNLIIKYQKALFIALIAIFTAYTDNVLGIYSSNYFNIEFYLELLSFKGVAPDQYRPLPYIILWPLYQLMYFRYAVLVFKIIFFIIFYYQCFKLLKNINTRIVYAIILIFSLVYPYAMDQGYRPITILGVLLVSSTILIYKNTSLNKVLKNALLLLFIFLISITRSDTAFFVAIFLSIYYFRNYLVRGIAILLPIGMLAIMKLIFPDAKYYTSLFKLKQNLLFQFPKTILLFFILPFAVAFWERLIKYLRFIHTEYFWFFPLLISYLLALSVIARVSEFRVYLHFVPFLFMFYNDFIKSKKGII